MVEKLVEELVEKRVADRRQEESAEVELPGGWKAKISGVDSIHLLTILLIIFAAVLIMWDANEKRIASADQHKAFSEILGSVISTQAAILKEVQKASITTSDGDQAIVYMLSLSQAERTKLKIDMPKSLRQQVAGR